jgi:peptidoglycan hydrolase-like protein with peptidoglycan-binding domain
MQAAWQQWGAGTRRPMQVRKRVAFLSLLALLCLSGTLAARAQARNDGADVGVRWAQRILDDEGLYQGRATGKLDPPTAAALSAYQRKRGLPVTGKLDQVTIDRMLQERPQQQSMGNLADPANRAKPSAPLLREEEIKPKAAPAAHAVERNGGQESGLIGGGLTAQPSTQPSTPATASVNGSRTLHSSPTAAPRATVAAQEISGNDAAPTDDGLSLVASVPHLIRYLVIGATLLLALTLLIGWLRSGRAPHRMPVTHSGQATAMPRRTEPRLASDARARQTNPAPLTAPPHPRRSTQRGR